MINLQELGFTQEELQNRVVDGIIKQILSTTRYNPDQDYEFESDSDFKRKLDEQIKNQVTNTINSIAEANVLPNVNKYIEELVLQKTNQWGEKTGQPVTFIEYLVERANTYITEEVNHEGKSREENKNSGYSWNKNTTRISYLINTHLQYSIKTAVEQMLKSANSQIAKGIEDAIKIQMASILEKIKVETKV